MDLKQYIAVSVESINTLISIENEIYEAINICSCALKRGNTIFFIGNGGSAAEAQHLAAEFLGKFILRRKALPACALTVDSSAVTAIANDFGYNFVFSRQLEGLAKEGDVLIGLSTSGESENVIQAFKTAASMGLETISLTHSGPNSLDDFSQIRIKPDAEYTNYIQECHLVIGHYLCMKVEEELCATK
jgi:D-sedoheptulose 7-phosphate isomerase